MNREQAVAYVKNNWDRDETSGDLTLSAHDELVVYVGDHRRARLTSVLPVAYGAMNVDGVDSKRFLTMIVAVGPSENGWITSMPVSDFVDLQTAGIAEEWLYMPPDERDDFEEERQRVLKARQRSAVERAKPFPADPLQGQQILLDPTGITAFVPHYGDSEMTSDGLAGIISDTCKMYAVRYSKQANVQTPGIRVLVEKRILNKAIADVSTEKQLARLKKRMKPYFPPDLRPEIHLSAVETDNGNPVVSGDTPMV